MIGEGWIINDIEGNGPGLIDMLFRLLLGESEENQDTRLDGRCPSRNSNRKLPE
jgi:hypothetical protein